MRRGTTPTFEISLNGIDVSEIENVHIAFKQYKKLLIKYTEDITVDENKNAICVTLSQEDTLMFSFGYAYIQLKFLTKDGFVTATAMWMEPVEEILEESVIT